MPAVVRFGPIRDITGLRDEMNRLFTRASGEGPAAGATWSPALDIFDGADEVVLQVEVPGLDAEDIQIEVDDNVLTLSGERRFADRVEEGRHHRLERVYGRFARRVTLPQGVRVDAITAAVDRGVLEVRVPKAEEAAPRTIVVRSGGTA